MNLLILKIRELLVLMIFADGKHYGKNFETESMDIVDFEIENGKGILFSDDIAISSLVNKMRVVLLFTILI